MEALNNHYQFLFFLSFILSVCAYTSHSSNCAPGIQSVGVTLPKGDIKIEYGNPLEIFCILDRTQTNSNASSLVFYYNEEMFPKEYVTIVNDTTLRLFVKKPPINSSLVSCKLRIQNGVEQGVCLNYVYVGTKPQEVKNFTCISYNWESLNCSWTPEPNPVKTTYTLSYSLKPRSRTVFLCPGNTDADNNYCLWNATTTPPHRLPYQFYYFKLTGSNFFGNITKQYQIDHYAVVLPRKPENLTFVEATSSSLTISWSLPLALKEFPGGIRSKVLYQSKYDPSNWQEADMTNLITNGTGQHILNITGLKYAHTLYDIRVYLKSNRAEDSEKWWSEPSWTFCSTKPAVPGMPPKTDIGSFDSTARARDPEHRKIYLYWQQIPKSQENGDGFGYNVSSIEEVVNGVRYSRHEIPEIHKSGALFKQMTYNTYIFKIISYNKEGISKNYSTITVPSKAKSPAEPVSFTKIAYANEGVYELSWRSPPRDYSSEHSNIESYTIFWCDNKNDIPYQCTGVLNWTRVDKSVTEKNITLPGDKPFQFAISANTANSSSGMVWAECTVLPDQERGKLKNLWINSIGSTYMELKWKFDCLRTRSISGFEVTYCPVTGPQDPSCKDGNYETKTLDGNYSTSSHYRISNLRPYTTYKVYLAIMTKSRALIKSDPLQNTTMEAVPDGPPEDLKVIDVSNTSITLEWGPPTSLNGVLRYYIVSLNNSRPVHVNKRQKNEAVVYNLTGLSSYEDYHISVAACTIACSNKSANLIVRTKIGMPGKLNAPAVGYYNKTDLNISWTPLQQKRGGKNEYFEILIQILTSETKILNETLRTYNNSGSMENKKDLHILTPGCERADSAHLYKVKVRAVNLADDKTLKYFGPWSDEITGFCMINSINSLPYPYVAILLICGFAVIVLFMAVGYVTRCIWKRCKAMQNIRVKLPPQLELDMYKGEVIDLPMSQHIPHQKPSLNSDSNDTPPPNQPLLPEKKEKEEFVESSIEDCEDACGDRDSSGCGSGHDSVSSSITAGTHITDSGTEADERPEDVFADSPRRNIYQGQRNPSRSGSGGDGYCILVQAPSGYVSLPPITGYVKHDWTPNAPVKGCDMTGSVASPSVPAPRPQSNETSWAS